MSIPLTGTGGLFTRLGLQLGTLNSVNTYRGTTLPPAINALAAQYATTDQIIVDNLQTFLVAFQNVMGSLPSQLQSIGVNTVLTMVNEAVPQSQASSMFLAMTALINQMIATSQTVKACTVGSSVVTGSGNIGNGIVIISPYNVNGLVVEDCFAELVTGTCNRDAQSGGAVAGQEQFQFLGTFSVPNTLSASYPAGSGSGASLTAINPAQYSAAGTRNYLYNGNFELWGTGLTANVPTGWTIATGTAGTTVLQSTSVFYDGLSSLQIVGNGTELTALTQSFSLAGISGQTSARMLVSDQMAFNAYVRVSATPSDGTLEFALVDGSGTIINDNQGTPNVVTKVLSGVSTTWVPVHGFFRSPALLPASVNLRVSLSTALDSGKSVYVDHLALAEPVPLYRGGPSFAVFSASSNFILGDTFACTITNDYGGGFQYGFDKFFGMKGLGLLLPSSGSPTISDALITT